MQHQLPKILIIYANAYYPLRNTLEEYLYSFKKYAHGYCFYFNVDTGKLPKYIQDIDFDMIIFPPLFLSSRWRTLEKFKSEVLRKIEVLKKNNAIKIILPQDEYYKSDFLCDFINEYKIDIVYSLASSDEWKNIYSGVDFSRVRFFQVLTGYYSTSLLKRIQFYYNEVKEKTIDIGYRAANSPAWLGKHGYLKTIIGHKFIEAAKKYQLITDISNNTKDTIYGNDWFKFLLKCKYTIGVEGGASVIDRDGSLSIKGNEYVAKHPNASYEEIERACFPGMDGNLNYTSLSPRHLEACATKTCQVLVEGSYNNILRPNIHYIELKYDLRNLDEVLQKIKNDNLREMISETAYNDIVASQKYTYKTFVEYILNNSIKIEARSVKETKNIYKLLVFYRINQLIDLFHYYSITKNHYIFRLLNMFNPLRLKLIISKIKALAE